MPDELNQFPPPEWLDAISGATPPVEPGYSPEDLADAEAAWQAFVAEQTGQPQRGVVVEGEPVFEEPPVAQVPPLDVDVSPASLAALPPEAGGYPGAPPEAASAPLTPWDAPEGTQAAPPLGSPALGALSDLGGQVAGAARDLGGGMVQAAQEMADPVAYAESLARKQAELDYEREQIAARRTAEAAAEQKAIAEKNYQVFLQGQSQVSERMARLDRDWQQLAQLEIDPNRWYREASTTQKIGAALASIAGGVLAGMHGGPNHGAQSMFDAIDRDINAQRDQMFGRRSALQAQGGIVRELYEMTGDAYHSAEAARIASYAMLDKTIAAEQAQYDPEGSRAARLAQAGLEARMRMAKAIADAQKGLIDDQVKVGQLEVRALQAELAALKAQKEKKGSAPGAYNYGPKVDKLHILDLWDINPQTGQRMPIRATDEVQKKEYEAIAKPSANLLDLFPELRSLRKEMDAAGLPGEFELMGHGSDLAQRAVAIHNRAFNEMRRVAGTGANLTEAEIKGIWGEIGRGEGVSMADFTSKWEQTEQNLIRKLTLEGQRVTANPNAHFIPRALPRLKTGATMTGGDPVVQREKEMKQEMIARDKYRKFEAEHPGETITTVQVKPPTNLGRIIDMATGTPPGPGEAAEFEASDREEARRRSRTKKKRK